MIAKRNTRALFIVIGVVIIILITIVFFYTLYNSNYTNDRKGQENINIEFEGIVNYVIDGDTLDINDNRIRLSLVNTPERGQERYIEAKDFVKNLCLNKKGQVDIDDGQRRGDRYGREVGVVYCDEINLNRALIENNLAVIYSKYCEISEFSNKEWAKPYCY